MWSWFSATDQSARRDNCDHSDQPQRRCVCVCVCAARVYGCHVFAIYDNNILPRLIMIIIKTIILYFIQITHTDDFPSTGTRLVNNNPEQTQLKSTLTNVYPIRYKVCGLRIC